MHIASYAIPLTIKYRCVLFTETSMRKIKTELIAVALFWQTRWSFCSHGLSRTHCDVQVVSNHVRCLTLFIAPFPIASALALLPLPACLDAPLHLRHTTFTSLASPLAQCRFRKRELFLCDHADLGICSGRDDARCDVGMGSLAMGARKADAGLG